VCDKYIGELVAAVPELVVIKSPREMMGGMGNKQLEAVYNMLAHTNDYITEEVYDIIRKWALNR
jgi:hypothetical protein